MKSCYTKIGALSGQKVREHPLSPLLSSFTRKCSQAARSTLPGQSLSCPGLFCSALTPTMTHIRSKRPFRPPKVTLKQIHDAVPKELLRKDPIMSASYIIRDVMLCTLLFKFSGYIPLLTTMLCGRNSLLPKGCESLAKGLLWLWYWWWQGLVFTSFFCIGQSYAPYVRALAN